MTDEERKLPKIFSDRFVKAIEDEVKSLVGEPMFRQLKAVVDKTFEQSSETWKTATDRPSRDQEADIASSRRSPGGLFEARVRAIVSRIEYKKHEPGRYALLCERDKKDPQGRMYLQVECQRPDAFTGTMGTGRGRKAYLSEHMINDEIVRLALGLFMAYEEHETREGFLYKGRAIFGPHISINTLFEAADRLDFRENTGETSE